MRAFLFGLVSCVACSSNTVTLKDLPAHLDRPAIVFVPGFYGSALADEKTGERYFLSAWKATFSTVPLALHTPDLGVEGARPMKVDGLLTNIPLLPWIYSQNVYGEAIDFLQDNLGEEYEIVPFAYDWRQPLPRSAQALDALVRELKSRGAPSVSIVAHSMGGLVTTYFLRYGAQSPETAVDDARGAAGIRTAVLAGVPFGGSATAFRNLQLGTSLGPASIPLNQKSLSTFPSMYHLLPAPGMATLVDQDFRPSLPSVYIDSFWEKHGWGLFREAAKDSGLLNRKREANTRFLFQARLFWERLHAESTSQAERQFPVLVLVGKGEAALAKLVWSSPDFNTPGKWLSTEEAVARVFPRAAKRTIYEDGDAVVPLSSAYPPAGLVDRFQVRVVSAASHHQKMFTNDKFREEILAHFSKLKSSSR